MVRIGKTRTSQRRFFVQGQRFETIEKLRNEVATWATHCNAKQKSVQWQLKIENARIKLHSLYPKTKS